MARIMTRGTLAAVLAALGGVAFAQENVTHREIRGPKSGPGAKAIYGHLDQVVFTRDGTKMAGGAGANVIVWNVADGKEIVRMQLPDQQIYHRLRFTDDGKSLIWCGREDSMIRVFDVTSGRQVREFEQPNGGGRGGKNFSSRFLTFSADGKLAAFNGPSFFTGLDILDIATGKITVSIKEQKDVRGCAFSPDGKRIAAHSGNGGVHIWDTETGKLIRELHADDRFGGGAFKFATYSSDGKFLATGGHTREFLDVWNADTGKLVCSLPTKGFFYSVAFTKDNESILCVESGGQAYLYHLVGEKVIHRFNPPDRSCSFLTFSPDFKLAALVGSATERDDNARQSAIFLYELPAKLLNPPAAQVDEVPLDKLWNDLNTDNDLRLQRVQQAFRAAPKPTVELFRKKIPPAAKEQAAKVEQWITNLDDAAFSVRDQATKDLKEAAYDFAPLLKARHEQASAGEIRNRLSFVLKQMASEPEPVPVVRARRAMAVLEQMATPEARQLLTELADGAPLARLTVEARAVLDRMAKGKQGRD